MFAVRVIIQIMSVWGTIEDIRDDRKASTKGLEVEDIQYIPSASESRLEVSRWYRIDRAVSVYADMRGSTELSTTRQAQTIGKLYELFTGSWIQVLRQLNADYIDVKGDGGFGLFYGKAGIVQAVLAAITFRTLISTQLASTANSLIHGMEWEMNSKVGIHVGPLLVKRVGQRNTVNRQYNWLVWAGKPVNYSAKLSSLADPDTLLVTKPVYDLLADKDILTDHLLLSCGCGAEGTKSQLWSQLDSESEVVQAVGGIDVYSLSSFWCTTHGDEYFDAVRSYLSKLDVEVGVPAL